MSSRPNIPLPPKPSSLSKTGSEEGEAQTGHLNYEGLIYRPRQSIESIMDPKQRKRLLSNRASAQRSRVRKEQYIHALSNKTDELRREISRLRSLVGQASEKKQILENEKMVLKDSVTAWEQRLVLIQGETVINELEIERLKMKVDSFS